MRVLNPDADPAWRIPDALWERIAPLVPPGKPHPLGCHKAATDPRKVMDAIFFVLRTGCQWNALNATEICHSSSAHRHFQRWVREGVFAEMWRRGLLEYDALQGIDWSWLSVDGAMTKAPLGGEKNRPQSYRPRQAGREAIRAGRWAGDTAGAGG